MPSEREDWRAILLHWMQHHEATPDDQRRQVEALDGYRAQCVAEARAALLSGAPTVWVATDEQGDSWCCTLSNPAEVDAPGEWMPLEGPLTPPGTVRRYALVPIEEAQ